MSARTDSPSPALAATLAALGVTRPDDVEVEEIRRARVPGSVRVWRGPALLARTCRYCARLMLAEDLIPRPDRPGGVDGRCRTCEAARARARRREDPEAHRQAVRRWRARERAALAPRSGACE